jgi:hypothetical protein
MRRGSKALSVGLGLRRNATGRTALPPRADEARRSDRRHFLGTAIRPSRSGLGYDIGRYPAFDGQTLVTTIGALIGKWQERKRPATPVVAGWARHGFSDPKVSRSSASGQDRHPPHWHRRHVATETTSCSSDASPPAARVTSRLLEPSKNQEGTDLSARPRSSFCAVIDF